MEAPVELLLVTYAKTKINEAFEELSRRKHCGTRNEIEHLSSKYCSCSIEDRT